MIQRKVLAEQTKHTLGKIPLSDRWCTGDETSAKIDDSNRDDEHVWSRTRYTSVLPGVLGLANPDNYIADDTPVVLDNNRSRDNVDARFPQCQLAVGQGAIYSQRPSDTNITSSYYIV